MAALVRALIVEAHPFSSMAVLRAEDGGPLVLTRHAAGFDEVQLREGAWLTCKVVPPIPYVMAVRACADPPPKIPAPAVRHAAPTDVRLEEALRCHPTVHRVLPPAVVPVIWLSAWQIFELPSGSRHAFGRNDASGEGRVSSLLSEFQPRTATLRSYSGRRYKLVGPPGRNLDGEYVWQLWLSLHRYKLAAAKSVTQEVWSAIRAADDSSTRNR